MECLSLTVEEVMHIRQVLVKAELEKFQQYKDIYNAMKKGKVTSSCMTHIACIMYSITHKVNALTVVTAFMNEVACIFLDFTVSEEHICISSELQQITFGQII